VGFMLGISGASRRRDFWRWAGVPSYPSRYTGAGEAGLTAEGFIFRSADKERRHGIKRGHAASLNLAANERPLIAFKQ
jgi:hypothetical protein